MHSIYQERIAKSAREKYSAQWNQFDEFISGADAEVLRLKDKIAGRSTACDDLRRNNHELLKGLLFPTVATFVKTHSEPEVVMGASEAMLTCEPKFNGGR
jgi:hypothetical protein